MSRIVRALIASGMLLTGSRACGAQTGGFDLAWNDCIGLPSAAQNGAITFPGPRTGIGTGATGACVDPWESTSIGGGYQWTSGTGVSCGHPSYGWCGPGTFAPGFGTLQLAVARATETALQAGQRYLLPPISLDPVSNPSADPDSACSACDAPVCLFVYQVDVFQTTGTPPRDHYLLDRPIERAFVTWQSGLGAECSNAVETRRTTWGAIKAIYR
jgi:hypothetical protein